ncbi:hypothetical protein Lal_00018848 [Lupinus albus]|nr:hypothetical protein Lal_00018848 [Lupinus albus]
MLFFIEIAPAYHITNNSIFHERTKHMDIDCHVRLQQKLFDLLLIPTIEQYRDISTKPLDPALFHRLLSNMGIVDIHSPTRGDY